MMSCSQYWRRALRGGYAMAEVSSRFSHTSSPLWRREAWRNLIQGSVMLTLLAGGPIVAILGWSPVPIVIAAVIILALVIRTAHRVRWKSTDLTTRLLYGLHSHLQHVPILFGQLKYRRDRWAGKIPELIEYKGPERPSLKSSSARPTPLAERGVASANAEADEPL
jgi:hypothetical protein